MTDWGMLGAVGTFFAGLVALFIAFLPLASCQTLQSPHPPSTTNSILSVLINYDIRTTSFDRIYT